MIRKGNQSARASDRSLLDLLITLTTYVIGVFLDNAQDLLPIPEPSDEDYERRFSTTVQNALANGLTSIHDAKLDFRQLGFFKRYLLVTVMHGELDTYFVLEKLPPESCQYAQQCNA